MKFGLIFFILLFKLISGKDVAFHYSLSESELRDILAQHENQEYEDEEAEVLGSDVHSFFKESNSQLILDLDLFKQFWEELNKARESAADGDVNYLKEAIEFLSPLREYDISAPCLADIFHFLWTTYNYADTVRRAKDCNDCNCTREFKKEFVEYQWIFDGKYVR